MSKYSISKARQQAGSGIIALVALIVVTAGIGLVGYKVYTSSKDSSDNSTSQTTSQSKQAAELQASDAPEIKKTSDLDKAATTLDQLDTETDASDTTQLDGQLKDL